MAGKGDNRRPSAVDQRTFDDNWRRAFPSPDDAVIAELNQKLAAQVAKSKRGDPAARVRP